MKPILLFIAITFLIISCKTILLNTMLKDPRVENTKTIENFLNKNNFNKQNSLILKADSTNFLSQLLNGMSTGYYIFDSLGKHLCYNGGNTCKGVQFEQLLDNKTDSFNYCKNDTIQLEKILSQTYDLNENSVSILQFPKSKYYIVSYWQIFMGGKKGYKDGVLWMQNETKNRNGFTFININADMQENWGLKPNGKANLKIRKSKGNNYEMTLDNIPTK